MKTADVVERVLRDHPRARNSDKVLIAYVLQEMGFGFTKRQLDIFGKLSFESLTRARRKIQEEGNYLPDAEVAKQRRLKSYIIQQQAPELDAQQLADKIEEQPRKAISWLND